MEITLRRAAVEDLQILLKWRETVLKEVFPDCSEEQLETVIENNRLYYEKAISDETHIACFAYADDKIIGCGGLCLYNEMPSLENVSGQCAYLMNIYASKEYRGNGVGSAVVKWLVSYAINKGISKIFLESTESGRKFYKKLGFNEIDNYMKL